jgi:hypothetical protein
MKQWIQKRPAQNTFLRAPVSIRGCHFEFVSLQIDGMQFQALFDKFATSIAMYH